MKKLQIFKLLPVLIITALLLLGFKNNDEITSYKCMIQMTNYSGEGAYIAVSLINPEGNYEKTLYMQGDDNDWYEDIKQWWGFYKKNSTNIDAITGATISGGERTISIIQLKKEQIDAGYKIRFESAVEDQGYHVDDVEFELTSKNIKSKIEGKGFIRYVRMIPQKR